MHIEISDFIPFSVENSDFNIISPVLFVFLEYFYKNKYNTIRILSKYYYSFDRIRPINRKYILQVFDITKVSAE